MKNTLNNYDRLAKVIENAVVRGSGCAASESASVIDEEFILIRRSDLPAVEIKPIYSPARGEHINRAVARTASYHRGAAPSYYMKRALDILAIAQHAEAEEAKQEKQKLAAKRHEAWSLLNPTAPPLWDYNTATAAVKAQIDVVVNLMNQVDECKEAK